MTSAFLATARRDFHQRLQAGLWSMRDGVASNSDSGNRHSVAIGAALAKAAGVSSPRRRLAGSAAGRNFERCVADFLSNVLPAMRHFRPGKLRTAPGSAISEFEQYAHLTALRKATSENAELAAALGGDYIIRPDIVVARAPESDEDINAGASIVDEETARLSPLRLTNNAVHALHASISCKWTIRSDRSQNARAEALNLLRNRKGRAPHIAVVTAEPLPSRLASIAIGTGEIDCTYHIALNELLAALDDSEWNDARDTLSTMVEGNRLRDIADLPLDLVA